MEVSTLANCYKANITTDCRRAKLKETSNLRGVNHMWLRKVQVILTNTKDLSKKTIYQDHAIEFEVNSSLGWQADKATINIYNLSISEIKALQNGNPDELLLEIRAAHSDEKYSGDDYRPVIKGDNRLIGSEPHVLPTIFSGRIKNVFSHKRLTEHITTIYCITKAGWDASIFQQMRAIPKNTTLRNTIKSMCDDYGYHSIATFGVKLSVLDSVIPTPRSFHKSFVSEMDDLMHEYNLNYYIATAEFQIFSGLYADPDAVTRMSKDRPPINIDANFVIGNPIVGLGTINLDMFLNYSVQPGMIIDVSPLLGTELLANGVIAIANRQQILNYDNSVARYARVTDYQIINVIHRGQTHGKTFTTSVYGVYGSSTAAGLDESDWLGSD